MISREPVVLEGPGPFDFTSANPHDGLLLIWSESAQTWGVFSNINSLYPNPRDPIQTVWDDLVNSLVGKRLFSTSGVVSYDYENNAIEFSDGGDISNINDCIIWNMQFPHGAKLESVIKPHFHVEQTSGDDQEFTLWYRIQKNGAVTETE